VQGASRCAASKDTAAVRRAVTVGAVHYELALAGDHVKHHHVALNGGQTAARISRGEGNELGYGGAGVKRGHDKQAAAAGQGLHQARGNLNRSVFEQPGEFIHQQWVGQAGRRLGGVQQRG
jgi:hypothetical protein